MKKFLLVTMIGMVLVIDIYGIVKEFMPDEVVETEDVIEQISTVVYVE